MVGYARILKRQAGATAKELAVMAALFAVSFGSLAGLAGYGLVLSGAAGAH